MVHIIDKYYLDSDKLNVIVKVKGIKTNKNTGEKEEKYVDFGYYTTISQALNGLNNKVKLNALGKFKDGAEFLDLLKELRRIDAQFEELIKPAELIVVEEEVKAKRGL